MMTRRRQQGTSRAQRRGSITGQALALVLVLISVSTALVQGQTFTVLQGFDGNHGQGPAAGVIRDANGNLYGTTFLQGLYEQGTVYQVSSKGELTVLYNFTGGADGANPQSVLIRDKQGNLYGTTNAGGASGKGTVYRVSPGGVETVLHNFVGSPADGIEPMTGVVRDEAGSLYGVAPGGGFNRSGILYRLDPDGTETILHNFGQYRADSQSPSGDILRGEAGNIFGVAAGGSSGGGAVWKLDPHGTETILYNFPRGASPVGSLIRVKGLLYGVTCSGGTYGLGTVYEVSGKGQSVLYNFAGSPTDGACPGAGLIRDGSGNLYGTTIRGGPSDAGTVFELSPTGALTVLYSFTGPMDGFEPLGGVVRDKAGNLYGTTTGGGPLGGGTVFKLTP